MFWDLVFNVVFWGIEIDVMGLCFFCVYSDDVWSFGVVGVVLVGRECLVWVLL